MARKIPQDRVPPTRGLIKDCDLGIFGGTQDAGPQSFTGTIGQYGNSAAEPSSAANEKILDLIGG